MMSQKQQAIALLLIASGGIGVADAFSPSPQSHLLASKPIAASGFAPAAAIVGAREERPTEEKSKVDGEISVCAIKSAAEAKNALVDLIPRMMGSDEEYRAVESYVNLLESEYSPVHTIDFLNFAMAGEWQLLFSTNLMGRPNRKLRLQELVQKIDADGFRGTITNSARWAYAQDGATFDAAGQFNVKCSYAINQGARMVVDLDEHEVRPASGSKIPGDVPELVGLLRRAIPKEVFDPNGHAMDMTYLDADLKIVRLTGPNHEGVRNIFMRKGSLEISPE